MYFINLILSVAAEEKHWLAEYKGEVMRQRRRWKILARWWFLISSLISEKGERTAMGVNHFVQIDKWFTDKSHTNIM